MDTSHVLLPGQGGSWPGPSASPPARLCPQAMAATTVTDSGGVRIITEVIPATDPRAAQLAAGSRSPAPTASSFQVRGFRRAQPKALGVRHGVPGGTGHLGGKAGTEYPQGLSCLRFSLAGAEVMFGTGSRRCAKCQHTQLSQVPSRHRGTQPGRGVTVGSGWDAANSNGDIHPLPVLADRQRFGPRVTGGIPLPQTIHIFTGIIHVCFGIILMVSEYRTPSLPVASGVLFWLGLLLLLSGSLLVESEKRENISLVKICCVVNAGVILSTLVATLVHATAITHNTPGCETNTPYQLKADWCFNAENKILSNGLDSMFVIFSLLEFCVAVAALAFGYAAIKQHNYTRMAL
ncbi:membrane-spanning 4-domains subfamily A member 15 isoform 3-T3 [Sarcoramphus papa]